MHYQHRYHAGNFADVCKHVLLNGLLMALCRKDSAWAYIETHAGTGMYELGEQPAGEYRDGVARLFARDDAPAPVRIYLDALRRLNPDGLCRYPGSPWWAQQQARTRDRLLLCERVPAISAELKARFGDDARIAIHRRDGYESLSLLPPRERRALVLIDPPFERPDEFAAVERYVQEALRRFAGGVYAIWYPYKKRFDSERFLRRVRERLPREALNCVLDTGAPGEGQMHACGVLVINPPFGFADEAAPALAWLAQALAAGPRARGHCEPWPQTIKAKP